MAWRDSNLLPCVSREESNNNIREHEEHALASDPSVSWNAPMTTGIFEGLNLVNKHFIRQHEALPHGRARVSIVVWHDLSLYIRRCEGSSILWQLIYGGNRSAPREIFWGSVFSPLFAGLVFGLLARDFCFLAQFGLILSLIWNLFWPQSILFWPSTLWYYLPLDFPPGDPSRLFRTLVSSKVFGKSQCNNMFSEQAIILQRQ